MFLCGILLQIIWILLPLPEISKLNVAVNHIILIIVCNTCQFNNSSMLISIVLIPMTSFIQVLNYSNFSLWCNKGGATIGLESL